MADTVATRAAYGEALAALGERYPFYVLDADLSGSTMTGVFAKKFPDRFLNCGIAEENMISVAAGMSTTGVPVFASSFAMFACGRAYEQIRNSVAYPHLNVKIAASHAGVTVGEDGATHQFCEDLALMRSVPGMVVVNPADATETLAATEAILRYNGPVYFRLGRFAVPLVFDRADYTFDLFKAVPLTTGNDCLVLATGLMVDAALKAEKALRAQDIHVTVVNVHTLKPLDEETILPLVTACGNRVVTAEEHSVIGGLGSAVSELLCEKHPARLRRVGLNDVFGTSGKAGELLDYFHLNAEGIENRVKELLVEG